VYFIAMQLFVTGTDTNIGKTVISAWLAAHLHADYWKPVLSGLDDGENDPDFVRRVAGLPLNHIWRPVYALREPLSPHEAARREGVHIKLGSFVMPQTARHLIVEGAGGVLVPLSDQHMIVDLIRHLGLPAVLVARSTLGTINHTLLSLRALRQFSVPIMGVVMNGPLTPHNRQAIEQFGKTTVLAEIPQLEKLDGETLRAIQPHVPFSDWKGVV
jgi:dethiobiotin synthetase